MLSKFILPILVASALHAQMDQEYGWTKKQYSNQQIAFFSKRTGKGAKGDEFKVIVEFKYTKTDKGIGNLSFSMRLPDVEKFEPLDLSQFDGPDSPSSEKKTMELRSGNVLIKTFAGGFFAPDNEFVFQISTGGPSEILKWFRILEKKQGKWVIEISNPIKSEEVIFIEIDFTGTKDFLSACLSQMNSSRK